MLRHSVPVQVLAAVLLASVLVVGAAPAPAAARAQGILATPSSPASHANPIPRSAAITPASLPGPRPLGWLNESQSFTTTGNLSSVSFVLSASDTPMADNGEYFDLGDGRFQTTTGVTNFTSSSEPDFNGMASLATNGVNDFMWLYDWLPGGGGSGMGAAESYWFHGHPDLVGYQVYFIQLNVTTLSFVYAGGYTTVSWGYSWEFWGVPLFVFFVPPTDPDGYYLVDRTETNVSVGLAGPGNVSLEWNGANVSMSPSGPNWTADMSNLSNGVYKYRVWATNATGTVFATPVRTLTVGVGIFVFEHLGTGYWASVAASPSGEPAACYYDGTSTTYSEHTSSGWAAATIGGGGGPCSLAFDKNGNPHASFSAWNGGNYIVQYATRSGSTWTRTDIETGYYTPTSIAINPVTDLPMISYTQVPSQGLKLAILFNGTWRTEIVNASDQGQASSLAFDPSGNMWIAFTDYTTGALRLARWNASGWTFSSIATGVVGASIAFDSSGVAHIAYANSTGLQYATWTGTGWSTETVDPLRYYSVSLAFDAAGRPYIGYAMSFGGDIRVAVKNGTWNVRVVTHRNGNTGGVSLTTLPSGNVGLVFDLNDTNGDLVFATDVRDTMPPTTTALVLGAAGAAGWYTSGVVVILTAQDDWSGVRNTTFSLDGGPWTLYTGPLGIGTDGRHAIQYRSVDYAGLVEPIETTEVNIDTTPPLTTVSLSPPPDVSGWDRAPVNVTLYAADAGSGPGPVEYRVDRGTWTAYTAPFVVGDGIHLVEYYATDVAGNVAAVENVTVKVDTAPPWTTAKVTGTPGQNGWFLSPAMVNLTAVDNVSGVASLAYQVDVGSWQNYSAPFVLGDGHHLVIVIAADVAGNVEPAQLLHVDVDTAPPTISDLVGGHYTSSQVVVSWTGADTTSGIAGYAISVDGGPFQVLGGSPTAMLTLTDGTHQVTVRATDVAGNSVTQTVTLTVDTNLFSFTGPMHGIPTVALLVAGAAIGLYLFARRRRKEPPEPVEAPEGEAPSPSEPGLP